MSLLEQDTRRKGRVEGTQLELEADNNEEYDVEAIRDSAVYAREAEGHLPGLYYLVSWKGYPKEANTWEPSSTVHLPRKMISTIHKDHPEKLTATSPPVDTARPTARPTGKPTEPTKRKRGRPAKGNASKKTKKY